MATKPGIKIISDNRNARRNYEILDVYEAGMQLVGSEVKTLREGKISFKDGYIRISNGEAFLVGVHIPPYENAGYLNHEPERSRKLLLNTYEIKQLGDATEQKGFSLIPLKIYWKSGKVKLELAIARGKKLHDKREDLKRRAENRDAAREMARRR